jgi:hypothetical protein
MSREVAVWKTGSIAFAHGNYHASLKSFLNIPHKSSEALLNIAFLYRVHAESVKAVSGFQFSVGF